MCLLAALAADSFIRPHSNNHSSRYKSQREGRKWKADRLQPEKRPAIGKGQTRVGDRLQPSLTAPSMFNAVGQGRGRGWAATLMEEVSIRVVRLEGDCSDDVRVTADDGLPHKASVGRHSIRGHTL